MRTIPLHGRLAAGRVALVDDQDFELVDQYRWTAYEYHRPGRVINGPYAMAVIDNDGKPYSLRMHKLITGWPMTDHINHDGLDNRRANLRPATRSQNTANSRPRRGTASPYKGVSISRDGKKWVASIRVAGQRIHLGTFESEAKAALAYDAAARKHFGEFAYPNFPG